MLVEESVSGWDEFELEVVRDRRDNVVIVCSIENLDPMGVHTGDSVTVAPQMTLSDEAYQELRDAAIAVIRAVGVETGGSNIQFARERETGELRVIEMNPRVSRSSALASKATGYPIAKVAAKLAVGYTLDEIPNDLTKTTPASFEPTLDYVVVKFPRFAFEKFPGADTTLGTQMKSVGEAMGIGRTFQEAFWKAWSSRELDAGAVTPWATLDDLPDDLHPWFRRELEQLRADGPPQGERVYRRVDSCAGEVAADSNYFYSTCGEADEAPPASGKPRVVILGSGPNRIGQGIEFDYCCVHAAQSFRALGYEAMMVNCNPETVSTDYDTSDRLYFEPLDVEDVLAVCEREQPEGVVIQFGGQTPLKLARAIEAAGFRVLGTPYDAIDLAEDRERFGQLLAELGIRCPEWGIADAPRGGGRDRRPDRLPGARPAVVRARRAGDARLLRRGAGAGRDGRRHRLRARRPLPRGSDRDRRRRALRRRLRPHRRRDGARRGGRHPLRRLVLRAAGAVARRGRLRRGLQGRPPARAGARRRRPAERAARLVGGEVYVLEANPRASRTVPFASKATGVNLVDAACRLAAGARLHELDLPEERRPEHVSVKAAVLPFARFPGSDPVLGPEMRSTGEVMASAADLPTAFAKAERAAGRPLPTGGTAFLSVRELDKAAIAAGRAGACRARLRPGRHRRHRCRARGDRARGRRRLEKGDAVVDPIRAGRCDLVVNTPQGSGARRDGSLIRAGRARRARPLHHDARPAPGRRRRDRERARGARALAAGADRAGDAGGMRRSAAASSRPSRSARTRCSGSTAAGSTRASRASSSCSRRRAGCCRGR